MESALVVVQCNLAVFQTFSVEFAQKRRQHFSFHAVVRMIPFDVEVIGVRRGRAVFKNVHEHPISRIVSHVVRHDVLKPAETEAARLFG